MTTPTGNTGSVVTGLAVSPPALGTPVEVPKASTTSASSSSQFREKPIIKRRHPGRGAFAVVVAVVIAAVLFSLATNPNISWKVVGDNVFKQSILDGLVTTLKISILSMVVAIIIATVVAIARLSESKIISGCAAGYSFIFRGIPLIVQLIFWGNVGLFVKTIDIGIPFTDISWYSTPTAGLITPFVASIIGLSLAEAAYMAEIIRGGILSVNRGQLDATKALAMTHMQTMRHVVIPQALRVIVPPTGNQLIGVLKASAIVSVIAGGDLLTTALNISALNYRTIELLIVATIWYMAVLVLISIGQFFIERRLAEK